MTLKEVDAQVAQLNCEESIILRNQAVARAKVAECDVELADIRVRQNDLICKFKEATLDDPGVPSKE